MERELHFLKDNIIRFIKKQNNNCKIINLNIKFINNINDLKVNHDEFNLSVNMFIDEIYNIQENFKKDIERMRKDI